MRKSIICILLAIFTAAIVGCGGSSNRVPIVIVGRIEGTIQPAFSLVHIFPEGKAGQFDKRIAVGLVNDDYTFRVEVPSYGMYDIQIQVATSGGPENPGIFIHFHTMPDVQITSPTTDLGIIDIGVVPP